jgi:hypothetical protein
MENLSILNLGTKLTIKHAKSWEAKEYYIFQREYGNILIK